MKLGKPTFNKENVDIADSRVEFKSIITNFVTTQCTGTQDLLIKFLALVTHTYDENIKDFITQNNLKPNDISFIYKGGNVLRMIALKYLNDFPGGIKDFFLEKYKDILSKSDADFQIYVNKDIQDYDHIHKNIQKLSLAILFKLRNEFINSISSYFLFNQLNIEQQKIILQQYLTKLNSSAEIKNTSSPYYGAEFISLELLGVIVHSPTQIENIIHTGITKRQDFYITPSQDGTLTYPIISNEYPNGCDIFASLNQKIESNKGKNHVAFALSRIKLNSVATFKLNNEIKTISIPGELVDVSIPYRDDTIAGKFDLENNTKLFKLFDSFNNSVEVRAYSRNYIMHDLVEILFKVAKYPWLDNKYKKRLTRLSVFCFISDIHKFPIITIQNILNTLLQGLSKIPELSANDALKYMKAILPQINTLLKSIQTTQFVNRPSYFTSIFDEMDNLITILLQENNPTDIEEFKKYIINISESLTVFLECIGKMRFYLNEPFQEIEQPVTDMVYLGGSSKYYRKYLKYKLKYLNLLKLSQ